MSSKDKHLGDFDPFTFDFSERSLLRGDKAIDLPPQTLAILEHLIKNRNHWISREELMAEFWPGVNVSMDSVHRQISDIRRALGDSPKEPRFIETAYKRGWRFIASVTERVEMAPSPYPATPATGGVEQAETGSQGASPSRVLLALALGGIAAAVVAIWTAQRRPASVLHSLQLTMDGRPKSGPLVTDGRRVFFRERLGDHWHTVAVPVAGGDAVPLDVPLADDWPVHVSSDGSKLVLLSPDGATSKVWAYSMPSRELGLLRSGVSDAVLSPDGKKLAATTGADLSIFAPDGVVKSKTDLPAYPSFIRWSPDGHTLRFSLPDFPNSTKSAEWEFNERDSRARRLARISDGHEFVGAGSWSARGHYFFYEAGAGFNLNLSLWVAGESHWLQLLGAWKPRRLTSAESGSWQSPATDPNDESTVFAIYRYLRSELARFETASKTWRPEWNSTPAFELSYSKDCQWVAYTHLPDHTVWKARPDGSGRVRLTDAGIEAHQPHWSPDGKQIAYMGQSAKGQWRAFQVEASGGPSRELSPGGEDQGVPTWSPDGHAVIWGERLSKKPRSLMTIHVFDLRTKRLSDMPGTAGLWSPRWSPDGKYILAITADSRALRALAVPGLEWKQLARMRMVDNATWSVDSRFIYFNGREEENSRWSMFRVAVTNGTLERIVGLDDFDEPAENWFGVAADGAPLALRGVPAEEIFKLKCRLP
jgi:DNA-binding winged helix-turn-helix (wHTH) protein/Tol biopolymer transport system component